MNVGYPRNHDLLPYDFLSERGDQCFSEAAGFTWLIGVLLLTGCAENAMDMFLRTRKI